MQKNTGHNKASFIPSAIRADDSKAFCPDYPANRVRNVPGTMLRRGILPFAFLVEPQVEHQEMHMNLTVTGHHVDITRSMRNYVSDKMERLQRHSDKLTGVHVILSVEKLRRKAEATIQVAGTKLYADTTEPDMYAAIDLLTDKLDRQLIRHKEKLKSQRRVREPIYEFGS